MINLRNHFKTVARPLSTDMTGLLAELGRTAPRLDLKAWRTIYNNCYNFALDRYTDDFLQPGQAIHKKDYIRPDYGNGLEAYCENILNGAQKDGLRGIGYDFGQALRALKTDENLAALFFRESYGLDYHWFGLRVDPKGDAVWAHKVGSSDAESCREVASRRDPSGMIEAALSSNYDRFGGFYAMPVALAKPPEYDPRRC